jgi:hypothetical protein
MFSSSLADEVSISRRHGLRCGTTGGVHPPLRLVPLRWPSALLKAAELSYAAACFRCVPTAQISTQGTQRWCRPSGGGCQQGEWQMRGPATRLPLRHRARGAKSPTVATLSMLAEALAVPISGLVGADPGGVGANKGDPRLGAASAGAIEAARGATASGRQRPEAKWSSCAMRCRLTPPPDRSTPTREARSSTCMSPLGRSASCSAMTPATAAAAPHLFDNAASDVEAVIYLVIEPW